MDAVTDEEIREWTKNNITVPDWAADQFQKEVAQAVRDAWVAADLGHLDMAPKAKDLGTERFNWGVMREGQAVVQNPDGTFSASAIDTQAVAPKGGAEDIRAEVLAVRGVASVRAVCAGTHISVYVTDVPGEYSCNDAIGAAIQAGSRLGAGTSGDVVTECGVRFTRER